MAGFKNELSTTLGAVDHNIQAYTSLENPLSTQYRFRDFRPLVQKGAVSNVADAYNQAGGDYATYADGDPTRLFDFEGLHAYADRQVWATLGSETD